jgi:hypothetical protein
MKKHEIHDLLSAYGYQKQLDDPENYRTRFRHDETGFLDLWIGRKRTTIGIYNPTTKVMHYKRVHTMEDIEHFISAD